jgi:RNA polymerase sigma-70 factor (ECF subfamily)
MISAFRRAGTFRGESAVTTWLHRIVVNACLDRLRRKAARPATGGTDEAALDRAAIGRTAPDPSSRSDISLDVAAALRHLPPDQQAALVLVDMLGYPVADAAGILGVSPGTVKSRCARGRAKLLPWLAHLRQGGTPNAQARNRSAAADVLPAQEGGDNPS